MFELLLQADRSLADGLLDQAERTYWQLIELDPTNAIAVAGLARVCLERGDEKSAHEFANQALAIDPDSIAARRVIQAIAHIETGSDGPEPEALPLLAAERLEALSRRRGPSNSSADGGGVGPNGGRGSGSKARAAAIMAGPDDDSDDAPGPSQTDTVPGTSEKAPRGRTGAAGQLSEPMRERKASRIAAAGAAAAAAAHEPARPHAQSHHAMPVGRRFFGLDEPPRVPDTDDFAAAEMAAAVEAVDAIDEATAPDSIGARPGPGDQTDLLGAVDATAADESIALRIALVSGMDELEAAEQEAARAVDEESSDAFEAAEAIASSALHRREPATSQPAAPAGELRDDDFDQDAFDAAEVAAGAALYVSGVSHPGRSNSPVMPEPDQFDAAETEAAAFVQVDADPFADADAAEAAAAAEAVQEVSDAEAAMEPEPARARRTFEQVGADDPSEQDAESEALREALALVLDGEGGATAPVSAAPVSASPVSASPVPAEPAAVAAPPDADSAGRALLEAALQSGRSAGGLAPAPGPGSGPNAMPTVPGEPAPEPAPRKGLFRRIRGN